MNNPRESSMTPYQLDAIRMIREWADEHGEPPGQLDWQIASYTNPSSSGVQRAFGSWDNAIAAAGFKPRGRGRPRKGGAVNARTSYIASSHKIAPDLWYLGSSKGAVRKGGGWITMNLYLYRPTRLHKLLGRLLALAIVAKLLAGRAL